MISKPISQKIYALLFVFFIGFASMASILDAKAVAKSRGKQIVLGPCSKAASEFLDIAKLAIGEPAASGIDGVVKNLSNTAHLIASLGEDITRDSLNFTLGALFTSLPEAATSVLKRNSSSDKMTSSDFGEFLAEYKTVVLLHCSQHDNFAPYVLDQLTMLMPLMLQSLTDIYANINEATGFGLTFGYLSQGAHLMSMFKRDIYIESSVTQQLASFPEEILGQMETMLEDLLATVGMDGTKASMMLSMLRVYAQGMADARAKQSAHDEL